MGPEGLPNDPTDAASEDSNIRGNILDIELSAPGPLPPAGPKEPMLQDHPCARRSVDQLSKMERLWIDQQFLDFYCDSTRQSLFSKFGKFEAFCVVCGVPIFLAAKTTVYAYVRFLHKEPRGISMRLLLQYLAAILMLHQP